MRFVTLTGDIEDRHRAVSGVAILESLKRSVNTDHRVSQCLHGLRCSSTQLGDEARVLSCKANPHEAATLPA